MFQYWRATGSLDAAVRRAYGEPLDTFEAQWRVADAPPLRRRWRLVSDLAFATVISGLLAPLYGAADDVTARLAAFDRRTRLSGRRKPRYSALAARADRRAADVASPTKAATRARLTPFWVRSTLLRADSEICGASPESAPSASRPGRARWRGGP